ncbi:hypothetical protein LTR17_026881 [Elasticomyces elasticus]|nr:hypothetical protein LTR17_026881 [Elasticomyces elasticus]
MPASDVLRRFETAVVDFPLNLLDLPTPDGDIIPWYMKFNRIPRTSRGMQPRPPSVGRSSLAIMDSTKWVTIAQAGAHTDPHRDNAGLGTFLTCHQDNILFGWFDQPNGEILESWKNDIDKKPEQGNYRVIALQPGQTVYFPPGLVHCVCREREGGLTLLYGGHVLRQRDLIKWINICIDLKHFPATTNESTDEIDKWIKAAAKIFAEVKRGSGDEQFWGRDVIEHFWQALKAGIPP